MLTWWGSPQAGNKSRKQPVVRLVITYVHTVHSRRILHYVG